MFRIIFLIVLLPVLTFGQSSTIKGVLNDTTGFGGEAYVSIMLIGTDRSTFSDGAGNFVFDSLTPGKYYLQINGMNPMSLSLIDSIQLAADTVLELSIYYPPPCPYNKEKSECPICGKEDEVIPIVYGLPGQELLEASKNGEVILGGCVMFGCEPHWYCKRDEKPF